MSLLFTVSEVSAVLRRVDGDHGMPAHLVRYYARTGMVEPSARCAGPRGSRLYTVADIALLRFVTRARRAPWCLPERAVWGVLVYRGDELRALMTSGTGVVVVDDPPASRIGLRARGHASRSMPVADLVAGLDQAAARYRRRRQHLWTGAAWILATPDRQDAGR